MAPGPAEPGQRNPNRRPENDRMKSSSENAATRCQTGVPGLDDILNGGLIPHRLYLVDGTPGAGKTTLVAPVPAGGRAARREVPLRHPVRDARRSSTPSPIARLVARRRSRSSSWSPDEHDLDGDAQLTMFHPSEVELGETTRAVLDAVEARRTRSRVVFDSLSELRLLAQSSLRYRRQILALKQFFIGRNCTVLLLDDRTSRGGRPAAAEHRPRRDHARAARPGVRRRAAAAAGHEVPRQRAFAAATTTSRSAAAGSTSSRGWSRPSTAPAFAPRADQERRHRARRAAGRRAGSRHQHAADRPGRVRQIDDRRPVRRRRGRARASMRSIFAFDESSATLRARTEALGHPFRRRATAAGQIAIQQIDPAELSPGEFAHLVRAGGRAGRRARRRHRQPQRLPERDAGGAVPHRPAARAADATSAARA